jgi:glycosyltransferase involved in cell wall biosynthesis
LSNGRAVTIVAHDVGGIGGMERQLEQIICGLARDGFSVRVISRTFRVDCPGVEWVRVPGPSRPLALALPWFFLLAAVLTRARGRGIVHSTGAIVAVRSDVATVHYCHAAAPAALRRERARRQSRVYVANAELSAALSRLAERWCYRPGRVRALIGVSPRVSDEVRSHFPGTAVETIPNGVDLDRFRPDHAERKRARSELGVADDALIALFVGGDWQRKGLPAAIEALERVPDWRLFVVGAGERERMHERARELGVAERVRFYEPTIVIDDFYKLADAFVLPTRYETFSLVSYEAAASGLPLVATAVGGIEDILSDGESGFVVDGTPRSIASALERLGASPELRASLGREAERRARAYSWDAAVERYAGLYRRLSAA